MLVMKVHLACQFYFWYSSKYLNLSSKLQKYIAPLNKVLNILVFQKNLCACASMKRFNSQFCNLVHTEDNYNLLFSISLYAHNFEFAIYVSDKQHPTSVANINKPLVGVI